MAKKHANLFTSPDGILSYPKLLKKVPTGKSKDSKLAYSCNLIFNDSPDLSVFNEAIKWVIDNDPQAKGVNVKSPKFKLAIKKNTCMIDDDGERRVGYGDDTGSYAAFKQYKNKPQIICKKAKRYITDPDDIYAGSIVKVTFVPFFWSNADGGKGISFSLMNVLKVDDGERLGGGFTTNAADDFGIEIDEDDVESYM